MSQRHHVEEFIKNQECFPSFWNSLLNKENCEFPKRCQFSFENRQICTIFHFVDYILGMVGKVNKYFQQRYLMIWDAWSVVSCLRKHLKYVSTKLQQTHQLITFLSSLEDTQKQHLVCIVQQLIASLDLHFPCPSTSLDKRRMTMTTNQHAHLDKTSERDHFSCLCSLSAFFDAMPLHQSTTTATTHPHHRQLMHEIERVLKEIEQHPEFQGVLNKKNRQITDAVCFDVQVHVLLQDIFHGGFRNKW